MAKKINKDVDLEILTSLAMGESGISIAQRLNISTAYVSQVKTGKKNYNIVDDELKFVENNGDYTDVLIALNSENVDKETMLKYVDEKFKECIVHAKMWQYLHNKIMEDK